MGDEPIQRRRRIDARVVGRASAAQGLDVRAVLGDAGVQLSGCQSTWSQSGCVEKAAMTGDPARGPRRETMHEMDAATLDELRTLRARAYGPSADIDQDPAALRRLHELEGRRGAPDAAVPVEPSGHQALVQSEPVEAPLLPTADDGAEIFAVDESSATEPDVPVSARARTSRRPSSQTVALWTLSVLGAAALASGLTYSLTSAPPVAAPSGATQIDTLEPDPFIEVPVGWFGAGPSSIAFEYYGLTIFESTGGYAAVGTDCFAVVATEQMPELDADTNSWSMSGIMYNGCRAGAFPATVQFVVDSNAPQQLRDRFPSDSALQFVFDGSRVGVFLAPSES